MEVTKVTNEDGKACANLIKFLTAGRYDLTGEEAEVLSRTKQWLHGLAMKMAADLKQKSSEASATPAAPAPSGGFKVKSMGQLPTSKKPANSKKKR